MPSFIWYHGVTTVLVFDDTILQLILLGSLGDGSQHSRLIPGFVDNRKFYTSQIASLAASDHHVLVLTTNGKVYVFGRNSDGELGDCRVIF
jgi:alpha-tubulin suppressor-like RCC1 family protein